MLHSMSFPFRASDVHKDLYYKILTLVLSPRGDQWQALLSKSKGHVDYYL